MSAEGMENFTENLILNGLAETMKISLEMITEPPSEPEDTRSSLENLIDVLGALPGVLNMTLERVTVPEESVSSFNTLHAVLQEALEVANDVCERDMIPDDALISVRGICLSIMDEYIRTFGEMFEILSWDIDGNRRLTNYIVVMQLMCETMYEGLEFPSRYSAIRFYTRELTEILNRLAEVDAETPLVVEERNANNKLIEANTLRFKYKKIRSSSYTKTVDIGEDCLKTQTKRENSELECVLTDVEYDDDNDEPPRKKIKKVHTIADEDEALIAEDCTICMCNLGNNDEARRLPCLHLFHLKCVDKWLVIDRRCPVCRHDIAEEKEAFPLNLKD